MGLSVLTPIIFILVMNLKSGKIAIPWTIFFMSINSFSISYTEKLFNKKYLYIMYLAAASILFVCFAANLLTAASYFRGCEIEGLTKTLYFNFFKEFGFEHCEI
jgi:uncharacterized membrane protein